MEVLSTHQKKIVQQWFNLFRFGKQVSDREFINEAVKLMSQQVHSEAGYRKELELAYAEPEIPIVISGGINLFSELRKRLENNQIRTLDDLLGSLKRELSERDYELIKVGVEVMKRRNRPNRARVLRKHGIEYSETSHLCRLVN